jgi:heme-degrading monooxygenase HmoA
MFARQVSLKLRTDSAPRFARIIASEVVPVLRKQPGFADQITLLSPGCTEAVFITFWDKQESEEAFNRKQNPEVAKSLSEIVEGPPKVEFFEVIDSTLFYIAGQKDEKQQGKDMPKEINKKICPICHAKYPEEDNYCSTDGSRLEPPDANAARQSQA